AMRVQIDKTWCNKFARRIDSAGGEGIREVADGSDSAGLHTDVGDEPGISAPVEDPPAFNNEFEFLGRLRFRRCYRERQRAKDKNNETGIVEVHGGILSRTLSGVQSLSASLETIVLIDYSSSSYFDLR